MKTMTCKDMGGPCDAAMNATTPIEMMQKGRGHVAGGVDDAHKAKADQMKAATPEETQKWTDAFTKKWNATADTK